MNKTNQLIKNITEGIQEKKGENIIIANLTSIENTICKFFVICQGNTPTQVSAIVDSIKHIVFDRQKESPIAIDGQSSSQWVAMDYADVLVHIFLPETRDYYKLETLWADAELTSIPTIKED